ncbi:MAG: superoxide dismutase, Ni [Pseudomonadota bacterium]
MLSRILKSEASSIATEVDAHCDVPCAIYDPAPILISALTVVRMIDIMEEWMSHKPDSDLALHNAIARCVAQKEQHAEEVKHEVRVIWGDYLKAPQFEKFPHSHELVHNIMLTASKCKQGVDRADAVKLVELCNEFAELFWATKDVATQRAVCPYKPSLETVYPVL